MTWRDDEDDQGPDDELHERDLPDESDIADDSDEPELVKCPHCRKFVSEEAERCHHCGTYIVREGEHRPQSKLWAIIVLAVIGMLVLMFVF